MEKFYFEDFLKKANEIHNNKYDYSKVEYVNNKTKICIICPVHGEFWQLPCNHLKGNGCKKCNDEKRKFTIEEFIEKSRKIHGNKYDYSKVNYINSQTKVCIICPIHGEFWQLPISHIRGYGCFKCRNELIKKALSFNNDAFLKKAREIHGNKYDYSKVEYVNCETKVRIICPIHGEFEQLPLNHLKGKGCIECGKIKISNKKKKTTEEFIENAVKVHGDKYDYSKVKYDGNKTKVCIICPIHGEFWQTPNDHLSNKGCPYCKESQLERKINNLLIDNNIEFERQKRFNWLGLQSLDFYLPKYNLAIECQGRQHFEPIEHFGGEEEYKKRLELDELKYQLCKINNINILYYSDKKYNENIIIEENKLIEEIKNIT